MGMAGGGALMEAASGQTRRFMVGEAPPLAGGYTARPESAAEAARTLVPGSAVALASRSVPFEGQPDWRGVCGKTQIAAMIADSLWRSGIVDSLVWISATGRAAVLSGFAQASAAAASVAPIGKAESGAARFVSWLKETSQAWLVVVDDLAESAVPEGCGRRVPLGA
jgi:Mrp family chromosome partitioning ATPase